MSQPTPADLERAWQESKVPVVLSVCRCGARIEGLGASAHAWGVADHERKCAAGGGEGE